MIDRAGIVGLKRSKYERKLNSRWDDIDTGVLDRLPSLFSDVLSDVLEVFSGRFTSPVRLDGLNERVSGRTIRYR